MHPEHRFQNLSLPVLWILVILGIDNIVLGKFVESILLIGIGYGLLAAAGISTVRWIMGKGRDVG